MKKGMNRLTLLLVSTTALISTSICAYANDDIDSAAFFYFKESDSEEILELKKMEAEVYYAVNTWKNYLEENIEETININWNLLTKQYTYDSFINNIMESDPYGHIWVLPVTLGSYTVEVVYNKIKPLDEKTMEYLTDEEADELQQKAGTWMVIGSSLHAETINYCDDVNNVLAKNHLIGVTYDCFLLTAIPGCRYPMAVVMQDNMTAYIFPALSSNREHFIDNYVPEDYHNLDSIYEFENTLIQLNQYEADGTIPNIVPVTN